MDLQRFIREDSSTFSPPGVTNFLANFSPRRVSDARERVDAFAADPHTIITHAFELNSDQRALLAKTSPDELKADLAPVIKALRDGQSLRVQSILMLDPGADQPAADQQQQARTITITIGRGRCKITITIEL